MRGFDSRRFRTCWNLPLAWTLPPISKLCFTSECKTNSIGLTDTLPWGDGIALGTGQWIRMGIGSVGSLLPDVLKKATNYPFISGLGFVEVHHRGVSPNQ